MSTVIRWVLVALSIPLILFLARLARRSARQLDARIDEYRAEQEAAKNEPGAINPYANLAALFGADRPPRQEKR